MNIDVEDEASGNAEDEHALFDRLQLIEQQPLSERAASLNQLHQQLSHMVE